MSHREGYKKTKIGWIPEDWDCVEIGAFSSVIRGASPRPKGDPRYYGGNVPRLMGSDVTRDGKIVIPQVDFLTEEGAKRSRFLKKGALTLTCSGTVGIPSILGVDACVHDGFIALTEIDEAYEIDFLYYVFKSLQAKFDRSATHGGVFTNLTTQIIKDFLIASPPLPEQKKIASILTTVDDKISSIEHQIQQTEQLKKGLMEKLLTEGIGHTEFKDTKIGRIPKGWDVACLDDCCDAIQDGTHFSPKSKSGPFKYLTSKNIRFGSLDLTNIQYISEEDHQGIFNRCPVQYGDVLLTKDGANTGNVALNTLSEPFSLLSSVAFIRSDPKRAENLFLLQYFLSPKGQKMIKDAMAGQAITRITLTKLKAFKVPVPPLEEQTQIASILSTVDDKIEVLNQKKAQYQTLKKGLSQQLLTGQMRVKV